jgi:hypothetical protein
MNFARLDLQGGVIRRRQAAKAFDQVVHVQQGRTHD